ncbi:MAG: hypothetical protein Q4D56_06325 [Bacteroides sp.]|nr:hypothetical protein [Bacteroides sp.]
MKKIIYYGALVVLLIACMLGVSFLMGAIEDIFNIRLGDILMCFGFLVGIGIFSALKPLIAMWILDPKKPKNDIDQM